MREDYMYPHHEATSLFEKTKEALNDLRDDILASLDEEWPITNEAIKNNA